MKLEHPIYWRLIFVAALLSLSQITRAQSDTTLFAHSIFSDDHGNPSLDGWAYDSAQPQTTRKFVRDVPPQSNAQWSISLQPGWMFPDEWVERRFTGLKPGIFHLRFSAKGNFGVATIESSGHPERRAYTAVSSNAWSEYDLLDTLPILATDTVIVQLTGGGTEIATGVTLFNDVSLSESPLDARVLNSNDGQYLHNFPNPFSTFTEIPVDVSDGSIVTLEVFDVTGRSLGVAFHGVVNPGTKAIMWSQGNGMTLSPGMYAYVLHSTGPNHDQRGRFVVK